MGSAMKEVSAFSKTQTLQAVRTLPYPPVVLPEIYAMAKDHAACRPSEERAAELWARALSGQPLRSVLSGRGGLGGASEAGGRVRRQVERRVRPITAAREGAAPAARRSLKRSLIMERSILG